MSRTTKKTFSLSLLVALAATVVVALAATSAGAVTRPAAKVQTLHISAKPGMLMFNTKSLHAKPGKIQIVFDNPKNSGIPHAIALTGHGIKVVGKTISPGKTETISATVKKGSYTFYCPVPGHEAAGMKGTLTVS